MIGKIISAFLLCMIVAIGIGALANNAYIFGVASILFITFIIYCACAINKDE